MTRSEKALLMFGSGYNCAQSVASSFADAVGMDEDTVLRAVDGFGAGIARMQETCGAVSGAVFVLGLAMGRGRDEPKDKQNALYGEIQSMLAEFEADRGSYVCRELLPDCDLRTAEGQAAFRDRGLIEGCRKCVECACGLLEQRLAGR